MGWMTCTNLMAFSEETMFGTLEKWLDDLENKNFSDPDVQGVIKYINEYLGSEINEGNFVKELRQHKKFFKKAIDIFLDNTEDINVVRPAVLRDKYKGFFYEPNPKEDYDYDPFYIIDLFRPLGDKYFLEIADTIWAPYQDDEIEWDDDSYLWAPVRVKNHRPVEMEFYDIQDSGAKDFEDLLYKAIHGEKLTKDEIDVIYTYPYSAYVYDALVIKNPTERGLKLLKETDVDWLEIVSLDKWYLEDVPNAKALESIV